MSPPTSAWPPPQFGPTSLATRCLHQTDASARCSYGDHEPSSSGTNTGHARSTHHRTALLNPALIDQGPGYARHSGACPRFAAGRAATAYGSVCDDLIRQPFEFPPDPARYELASVADDSRAMVATARYCAMLVAIAQIASARTPTK